MKPLIHEEIDMRLDESRQRLSDMQRNLATYPALEEEIQKVHSLIHADIERFSALDKRCEENERSHKHNETALIELIEKVKKNIKGLEDIKTQRGLK